MTVRDGVVVVDKPGGVTSHDVIARVRRWAQTRRVGHAGTLDPMATGVLVVGIGTATRLLGHLTAADKEYDATIRLGVATTTDDAEGEPLDRRDASTVSDDALLAAIRRFTGRIEQVPSSVSAVKVDGERAYVRARRGEAVELTPRPVEVRRFDVVGRRGDDVDVHVECSSGTYVRALARDVGAALGVGGHLTALRRTRVGRFALTSAVEVDALDEAAIQPLADVVRSTFPAISVTSDLARRIGHGQRVPVPDVVDGMAGVFAPDGSVVALVQARDGVLHPAAVFAPEV